jgi:hypothetical protein
MKSLAFALFFGPIIVFAQVSDKILSVNVGEAREGQPLTIQAQLVGTVQISQVLLAYRQTGTSEYRKMEMQITGNTASATIPASDVIPLQMEYYFILLIEGRPDEETFPVENPEDRPFRVQIAARQIKDDEIIFLSPEEGAIVSAEEMLVSISLLRASSSVNRGATKIYIGNRDVTTFAVVTDELITLVPENVTPPLADGPQTLRVELYDKEGKLYHSRRISYKQLSSAEAAGTTTQLAYNGSATLEARNENIQKTSTSYNRANITAWSQYGILRLNGRVYVTNEEKTDRQPQNRFFIEGQTPWLRVGYGDAYPTFPNLIMTGKRIRGLTGNLTLGFFNFDFAQGEITRNIGGDTLRTFPLDSLTSVQNDTSRFPRTGTFAAFRGDTIWAEYRYGTFRRDLLAVRPSFGSGKNFQWGFTLLKSKDDIASLTRDGVVYGGKPEENVLAGTDLVIAFDNRKFELTAQGAASLYNSNISSGNLRDSQIDSLYTSDKDSTKKREDLKKLRDLVSKFITVNQSLVPLSVERITSVMAYETALALNYFNNYLKASYIFRGSGYNSFGQSFLRKDVKGINIFDRLRLLESQLFLSGGFERLEDNVDKSKNATTTFTNINATVSYFPRINLPNVTVGYGLNKSTNGLIGVDTTLHGTTVADSSDQRRRIGLFRAAIEEQTNRIFVQVGYPFTAVLRHNASISFSTANRDDKTLRNADTESMNISPTVTTTWRIPLETTVGLSLNLNKLPSPDPADTTGVRQIPSDFNYTSVVVGGRYRMLQDKMRIWGTVAPTFGSVKRTTFDVGGEYFFYQNLSAFTQISMLQNPGVTDLIWSLMLRYNI